MKNSNLKRILIYFAGMIVLACGLTLNTKVTLGVSPLLAFPYALSVIFDQNFADLVFLWYCLFIAVELLIHLFVVKEKDKTVFLKDILQIAVSLIFTRIMNVVSSFIPTFATDCHGFFASLPFRLIMLAAAIVLTGIGAALTLGMKLVPNPGDGVVAAIAQAIGKPVGTAKNIVDISCVFVTTITSLILSGKIYGIGIGTLVAMLGVGRVISFVNRKIGLK